MLLTDSDKLSTITKAVIGIRLLYQLYFINLRVIGMDTSVYIRVDVQWEASRNVSLPTSWGGYIFFHRPPWVSVYLTSSPLIYEGILVLGGVRGRVP